MKSSVGTDRFRVKITATKNCFINLPKRCQNETQDPFLPLSLQWRTEEGKQRAFVSWNGGTSQSSEEIEISRTFAESLGLACLVEKDPYFTVLVSVEHASLVSKIQMEPATPEDWDIIELQSVSIEAVMLQQISVVFVGQVIPIWLLGQTVVQLRVSALEDCLETPLHPLCLTNRSEIYVTPNIRQQTNENPNKTFQSITARCQPFPARLMDKMREESTVDIGINTSIHFDDSKIGLIDPRLWKHLMGPEADVCSLKICWVWADTGATLPPLDPRVCGAVPLQPCTEITQGHIALPTVLLWQICSSLLQRVRISCIPSSQVLFLIPKLSVTLSRLSVVAFGENLMPATISSVSSRYHISDANNMFQEWLKKDAFHFENGETVLLNEGKIFGLKTAQGNSAFYAISLNRSKVQAQSSKNVYNDNYIVLQSPDADGLNNSPSIILGEDTVLNVNEDAFQKGPAPNELGGCSESVLCEIVKHAATITIPYIATRTPLVPGSLLVCGGSGSGKTSICRAATFSLRTCPKTLVGTVWVSCADLVGSKMSHVLTALSDAWAQARAIAPSVLVLDDLHKLCPSVSEENGAVANAQSMKIAHHLASILEAQRRQMKHIAVEMRRKNSNQKYHLNEEEDPTTRNCAVCFVATATDDPESVHGSLRQCTLFDAVSQITQPQAETRTEILRALFMKKSCGMTTELSRNIDLSEVAARSEGYRPADLARLAQRACHHAMLRSLKKSELQSRAGIDASPANCTSKENSNEALLIDKEDLEEAFKGLTSLRLQSIKLATSSVSWEDVGGLEQAKKDLKAMLELPIQYQRLYQLAPVRLPSGALLYGPPGCGKTLLAGAVAKECGLNFISIKGPEVLDKYIGASEQAVRDLFANAMAAAPCILFFDEFEAIAPKRGNDNTGVTDRVVNQLLTFLDGVEGRAGVYCLAATSRPDMVDSALLRPGRLDLQIYCGFPGEKERLSILNSLTRKIDMTDAAKEYLVLLAKDPRAKDFSGADLQGLVNTAQLSAIHEILDESMPTGIKGDFPQTSTSTPSLRLTEQHFLSALLDTRASLGSKDRMMFQSIYQKFHQSRKANFQLASSTDDGLLRTALK